MTGRIGVLGGGRMGAGIAHAFVLTGNDVVVVERDEDSADAAAHRIDELLAGSARRGLLPERVGTWRTTTDRDAFADRVLVIEAVPEDRALKVEALAWIEQTVDAECLLASNTSSIPIGALAASLTRPERFLGMHFFNPVPASALVELVTGPGTGSTAVDSARAWTLMIGKEPIIVRDSPGFASSRLGVVLGLEAIRMLEEGVATAEDIDRALELGYRHPTGPLRTTDLVGLDVRLGIAEELHAAFGERFAPPELLRRMVAEGRLGRKSGEGFYRWDDR